MTGTIFLRDSDARLFSGKERLLYFSFLIFCFSIYAPGVSWLYNVCMWLLVVSTFFVNTPAQKKAILRLRPAILLMAGFFLINCFSTLLSTNRHEAISWLGIRLSLFVLPLSLGAVYIRAELKDRMIAGFVTATFSAALMCGLYGIIRSAVRHDWSLMYNDNLSELTDLQSIYFAMLINLSIIGYAYLRLKKSAIFHPKFIWPFLLVILPIHFLLASRIAIIFLYTLIILFSVYLAVVRKRLKEGLMLLTGLVLAGLLFVVFFPKTLNRFREMNYTHFDYSSMASESHFNGTLTAQQWNGANIRLAVWGCAWTVTQQHWLLGTGLGDKMDVLKKQYAAKKFTFGVETNRNVHNAYLDIWMSLGIVGLVVFLLGFFIIPLAACFRANDWFGLLVIVCLGVSLITETYPDRTIGNTLLGFLISFIISYKKPGKGSARSY